MGNKILDQEFERIAALPSSLLDGQVSIDRGQAEIDRIKLRQHIDLTPFQRTVLNIMLDNIDEDLQAQGLGNDYECSDPDGSGYSAARCTPSTIVYTNTREHQVLRNIDGVVDRYMQYREDRAPEDRSQPPGVSIERAYGDCEDYSILKYKLARASGIPADRLAIASLDSSPDERGGAHAVLMYRDLQNRWFVLNDNDPNRGELEAAEDYFSVRSAPYRYYNEDEAGFNPSFGDATFEEYVNQDTPAGFDGMMRRR